MQSMPFSVLQCVTHTHRDVHLAGSSFDRVAHAIVQLGSVRWIGKAVIICKTPYFIDCKADGKSAIINGVTK